MKWGSLDGYVKSGGWMDSLSRGGWMDALSMVG